MWHLKKCPRCSGDTYIDKSEGKWYTICLQCGHEQDLIGLPVIRVSQGREKIWVLPWPPRRKHHRI